MKSVVQVISVLIIWVASVAWAMATVLTVTGQAEIQVLPDQAQVTFTVLAQSDTAVSAKQQVDKNVEKIQQALGAQFKGLKLTSGQLQVSPIYASKPDQAPQLTGYKASRPVRIDIVDLSQLSVILDNAFQHGADSMAQIRYQNSHAKQLASKVRLKALHNAQQLAAQFANALGKKVASIDSIEYSGVNPRPLIMLRESKLMGVSNSYRSEQLTLKDSVFVHFTLH
ncbi:SIMPL domain-containing protein [Celerinatantimonas yamalensis]|uniref:SIMPL domain-containing protein n=1 Tax=Celerinatantimonas yamalensis TaxID=559956 RepID=A0ABW9GA65_9GAMM